MAPHSPVLLLLHSRSIPVCSVASVFSLRCGRHLLCSPYSRIHTPSSSAMKTPSVPWAGDLPFLRVAWTFSGPPNCPVALPAHHLHRTCPQPTYLLPHIWSTSWWQLRPSSCLNLKSSLNPRFFVSKVLQNTCTIWQPLPFDTATSLVRGTIISYLIWLSDLLPSTLSLLPGLQPCGAPPGCPWNAGLTLALGPYSFPSSFCQESFSPEAARLIPQVPPVCSHVTSSMTTLTTLFKIAKRSHPCLLDPFYPTLV